MFLDIVSLPRPRGGGESKLFMRAPPLAFVSLPLLQLLTSPTRSPRGLLSCTRIMTGGVGAIHTSPPKAITFDLDDTLWETMPPLIRANKMHIQHINDNYPLINLDSDALKAEMMSVRALMGDTAGDLTALRRRTIESLATKAGYPPDEVATGAMEVFMRERNNVELYDGVEDTLKLLRQRGYVLGSITNGNADVDRTPLRGLLDFAVVAGALGPPKPHPQAFLEAARLAGVRPEEVVHVGDDLETDVGGAREAGMRSVWFRKNGKEGGKVGKEEDGGADAVIGCLRELPALIEGWI